MCTLACPLALNLFAILPGGGSLGIEAAVLDISDEVGNVYGD